MQDFLGSVRRSLVFRSSSSADDDGVFGGFVDKIGSSIRKSLAKPPLRQKALPPSKKPEATQIRWRKGELIGRGAFGTVYMGMNLDSGELLAVKQVLIAAHSASKETTQAHIRELEEEVKLLKNLSHPNIVRYLGTAREDDSLNIFLEFVPGGSISSLLGKFGSFPESVVRKYTKQLLLGLEYLHSNGIMHRDIKGANILVDNKACIKLADFGASKKVVELATMTGAKSMKGTPYWMAPEVILQTGHSFSADIWSVGCTIIEMATGKPPWSQQYQEVAALFHIGTTKSHPPIPEHISAEAKDFLLKCLQKEPDLRPTASELLQHPFVTGNYQESHPVFRNSLLASGNPLMASGMNLRASLNSEIRRSTSAGLKDVCEMGSMGCSTISACKLSGVGSTWRAGDMDDDMCLIDDKEDFGYGVPDKLDSRLTSTDLNKSFNPMCEPTEDWPCKFDDSPEPRRSEADFTCQTVGAAGSHALNMGRNDFTFPCGTAAVDEDDEVTESKIKAFLDEKALDLKKLQTPLYEEFYNASNSASPTTAIRKENCENFLKLPPKSRSPKRMPSRRLSVATDFTSICSPGGHNKSALNNVIDDRALHEIQPPPVSEWKELLLDAQQGTVNQSLSFSERQKRWKEELDQELQRKREMLRQAGLGGRTPSPREHIIMQQRERVGLAFAGN